MAKTLRVSFCIESGRFIILQPFKFKYERRVQCPISSGRVFRDVFDKSRVWSLLKFPMDVGRIFICALLLRINFSSERRNRFSGAY